MKVTVNFDNVRVIVPCGAGELLVRDLMQLAITRYKKATSKTPNTWVVIHNLKLSSDGGILDPDDRLNDVADDREQIIAIYEEQNSTYHHHHNGGDGTSASSVGTDSPDIFQIEVNHNTLPSTNGGIKVADCDYGDVEITGSHAPSGITPLQVRRGSEPALNRLSPVSTDPDPTKRWSAAVIVGDTDMKQHVRRANSMGHSEDEDDEEDDDSRGEGSGEEKSTSSRLSRGSGRLSILGSGSEMCRWAEAADRQLYKSIYSQDSRREPLGSSGTSPDQSRDPESETSSLGDDREVVIVLKNETGPLGIHVVPEYDINGRDIGLVIQSIEPGGRTDRDGRLSVGDRIVEISGRSLVHVSFPKAQEIFKDALKKPDIKLRLVKCSHHLGCTPTPPSGRSLDLGSSGSSSSGGHHHHQMHPPPLKKPPPPVYPKPFLNKGGSSPSNTNNNNKKKDGAGGEQEAVAALVEGEERGGLITKVATVTPTKKVPATVATPSSATAGGSRPPSTAPLASNTRKIGRKIPIQLTKGPEGLGFSITTRDNPAGGNCPIYIKNILPKGAAIQDSRLKPGDRLLEVNGLEMTGKTQTEAVALLRNTPPGGIVDLVVSRQEADPLPTALPRELPCEQSDGDSIIPWKHRDVLAFDIPLNDTGSAGLGVSVKGKSTTGPNGPVDLGIFVKSVIHGGAASKDGRLCTNDQLVNINGISLLSMTNTQAMETLRRAMTQGEGPNALPNAITLTVARRIVSADNTNGNHTGSGDDSSISFGSHDRSDSVLSSGSSVDNLLCLGGSGSPSKQNGSNPTPDNSVSEASETTVIYKPRSIDPSTNLPNSQGHHHAEETGALKKQLSGRNPVIDRLMGHNGNGNGNAGGVRNESYLKASHESWGGAQLQQALYVAGINDPRHRSLNPQYNTTEKVVIEDEYTNNITKPRARSRTPDTILNGSSPAANKTKLSEGEAHQHHPDKGLLATPNSKDPIDLSQLSLVDVEKDANFYRDGFGRQSISEKRHAQLDARNTDTYQRNKKIREEKVKRGEAVSDNEDDMEDQRDHRDQKDQKDPEASGSSAAQQEPSRVSVAKEVNKLEEMNKSELMSRSRSEVVNGSSGVNLIRASSAESLLRPNPAHTAVTTGDSVSSYGTNVTHSLGPSLGMRKSSSLESLQTMVQELQREEVGRRNGTRNRAANGGVGGPARGRGCNESFRAAVDRSYEGPPGAPGAAEAIMETLEEESESGGSSHGGLNQRGKPLAMSSRQPSLSHDQRAHHLLHQPANDDMLHAYNNKEMETKASKKKGGLLKGLGSVFKFGKHRKITQETIQKLTREQLEQEAERVKARRAAQEEQERIQEQYRKLVEQQQKQQQSNPPHPAPPTATTAKELGGPPAPHGATNLPGMGIPPPVPGHHPSSGASLPPGQQHPHHHHHPPAGPGGTGPGPGAGGLYQPGLIMSSPSRQERMQQLRAQHQRKHQERQGHYPKDDQEEWYENDLKHRVDRGTERQQRQHEPEANHARSSSFDIYKEMERPGSRRGIADPNKFSHYMNYKEIQQHLRQYQHQEQQQQQQQFQPQSRFPPQTSSSSVGGHHFQPPNNINNNPHFHSVQQPSLPNLPQPSATQHKNDSHVQKQSNRDKRPISNYFEYESVQATYHASQQTAEVNTSSLPRRVPMQTTMQPPGSNNASSPSKLNGPPTSSNALNSINQQTMQMPNHHGARVKTQPYTQQNGNKTIEANGYAQHHQHSRNNGSTQQPQTNGPSNYVSYSQIGHRRDNNIPGSKV